LLAIGSRSWIIIPRMRSRLWWIGVLFMVGSTLFALGSAPVYAQLVEPKFVGITFFCGSIFFTLAALLQLGQTPKIDRPDWWAALVQFVGTIYFNVTTFTAMNDALTTTQKDIRVWAPDAIGSICFLVASALALAPVWGSRGRERRIAIWNMVGSVFFGIAAIASWVVPDTGELLNTEATNAFTFLGAVCFFAGARLLLPRR
jgi:drug/metabolite transporter (DMT)-like permease